MWIHRIAGIKMDTFDLDIAEEQFSKTSIYQAIREYNHHRLLRAIQSGESVTLRDLEFNSTYLHLIVNIADSLKEDNLVPMVYQLSNAGIDVNAMDYKGQTALDLAISRELISLMVALLRVGTDPADKDYKTIIKDQGSPFEYEITSTFEKYEPGMWRAVSEGDQGMVHMLANSWCRIAIVKDGEGLPEYARKSGKSNELLCLLEDYEPTLEFVHATLAGDEKRMLELLMDSRPCDPHIMDISHQERWSHPLTPRSLRETAIAMGHTHVLHLLPESQDSPEGSLQTPKPSMDSLNIFRPTKFKRSASVGDTSVHPFPPTLPPSCSEDTLKIDQRCYYFHEVNSFVRRNSFLSFSKKPGSVRSKKRQSIYRDYGSATNFVKSDTRYEVKSKMCSIS